MRITTIGSLVLGATLLTGCPPGEDCPNGLIEELHPTCGCENPDFAANPLCAEDPCPDGFVAADDPVCNCEEFPEASECVVDTPDTIAEARGLTPTLEQASAWDENIFQPGDRDMYSVTQTPGNFYFAWANRPGNEADGSASGGTPDTVIRMYTGDGTEIAVNDDMPFRLEETDAGMWWQASSADPVYVEVLEWADWRNDEGDNESAVGGDEYQYRILVLESDSIEIIGDNDTPAECLAGEGSSFNAAGLSSDQITMVYGNGFIDAPGDVDYFQLGFEGFTGLPEGSELMCQFGFWPGQPTSLQPQLDLYWEDCSPTADDDGDCDGEGDDIYLLGSTNDPDFTPPGLFLGEDAGIMGVIPDGRFYAAVSSAAGESGVGHAYTLMYTCYNTTNFFKETEVGSEDPLQAGLVALNNPNDPGTYFGRFYGNFNPGGEFTDDFDAYAVVDGLGAGRFLDVEVESETAGATTGDLTMKLWRNEGGGNFTELTSVTGPDPVIEDYALTADDIALVVTLESDGTVQDLSTGYYGLVVVTAE